MRARADADAVVEDGMIAYGEYLAAIQYLGHPLDSCGGACGGFDGDDSVHRLPIGETAHIDVRENGWRCASLIDLIHPYIDG